MMERILDLVKEDYVMPVETTGIGIFHEEIIRCRDCRLTRSKFEICKIFVGHGCNPDGFCAWAERDE